MGGGAVSDAARDHLALGLPLSGVASRHAAGSRLPSTSAALRHTTWSRSPGESGAETSAWGEGSVVPGTFALSTPGGVLVLANGFAAPHASQDDANDGFLVFTSDRDRGFGRNDLYRLWFADGRVDRLTVFFPGTR